MFIKTPTWEFINKEFIIKVIPDLDWPNVYIYLKWDKEGIMRKDNSLLAKDLNADECKKLREKDMNDIEKLLNEK